MTNLEIDRALALAIGWKPEQMDYTERMLIVMTDFGWRRFYHLDPAVIWPIAERFYAFPYSDGIGLWRSEIWSGNGMDHFATGSCAATAVALAVIKANPYGIPTK